jgi:uncharacterized protein involved in exopolysaccharide biosynthesis
VDGSNEVLAPIGSEPELETDYDGLRASESQQQPVMQTIDIAWLLWARRRFVARFTAQGVVLFILIAFLIPKRYTATVHLMPPSFNNISELAMSLPGLTSDSDSGSGSGGGSGGGGKGSGLMGLASQLLGLNSSGQLFVGVLQSRTIEDDIINRFGLMKRDRTRYIEDARKNLEGVTEINVDDKTGILSIAVEDKDPKLAAAIADAYVENLNKVLSTVNISSAHRERVFIEKRRAEVKIDLDESSKVFSEFSSQNAAIDLPEQAKAMVQAGADLQAQLIGAQSMLTGLRQIYTDNNPRVRQMEAQVAELERQVNKVGGKEVTPANGSKLGSDELYPSVRQLPLLGVRYLDLYRRTKIDEAVYELLTKQYEIAILQEARDVPSAQVLDPAVVPQKKTSPSRTLIVLGGMAFSFLAGVCGIISEAYWKRTDPRLPWKLFATEVFLTCKSRTWDSTVGLRIRGMISKWRDKSVRMKERS